MVKCRRMKWLQFMSENWIYSWQWNSSRIRQQFFRWESFAMKTDTHTSGSTVRNHISLKMVLENSATRKISYRSWFLVYLQLLQARLPQHPRLLQVRRLIDHSDHHPAIESGESVDWQAWWDPCTSETSEELLHEPTKIPKPNKTEDHEQVRGNPCSDIPEWLQEFRENLVDERVPGHRDSHASSSHDPSLEPMRSVDLGKHSVYTHFPEVRNCEICQRTKITRAPCRRTYWQSRTSCRKFWWFNYSRSQSSQWQLRISKNHRYALVVQDLATQWIQSYPCKNKTSQETQRSLQKFLGPERKPKVIYTDNSLEFGKACVDLSWNHCTSTPRRSQTNGIAERAVRRVKEGTSAVLLQSGLDEKWWAESTECYTYLRNTQDLLSDGKTPYERRFF